MKSVVLTALTMFSMPCMASLVCKGQLQNGTPIKVIERAKEVIVIFAEGDPKGTIVHAAKNIWKQDTGLLIYRGKSYDFRDMQDQKHSVWNRFFNKWIADEGVIYNLQIKEGRLPQNAQLRLTFGGGAKDEPFSFYEIYSDEMLAVVCGNSVN